MSTRLANIYQATKYRELLHFISVTQFDLDNGLSESQKRALQEVLQLKAMLQEIDKLGAKVASKISIKAPS
jgi:hypothetical protein